MISKACGIDHPRPKAVTFCFSSVISESEFSYKFDIDHFFNNGLTIRKRVDKFHSLLLC